MKIQEANPGSNAVEPGSSTLSNMASATYSSPSKNAKKPIGINTKKNNEHAISSCNGDISAQFSENHDLNDGSHGTATVHKNEYHSHIMTTTATGHNSSASNLHHNSNNNATNDCLTKETFSTVAINNNTVPYNNTEQALKFSEILMATEEKADDILDVVHTEHPSTVLSGINKLREQRNFCDITLLVDGHEFLAHRAVLATCSPHLFDFLLCLEETSEQRPVYKLGREVTAAGFKPLLDFMYTGRLTADVENVPTVYATALALKMETATNFCADFLSTHLTTANCLDIRKLTKDISFKEKVDCYIQENLENIINSKDFYGLTEMQVEVVGMDDEITDGMMERRMFTLVLDWVKNNLNDLKPKLDRLVEKVNVLYLDSDNTLQDCAQEDLGLSSDDEVVQDYQIMARRMSHNVAKKNGTQNLTPSKGAASQPFQKFNLNPEEAVSVAEREWSIIAIHKNSENAYLAIAMLDGHLMVVSVHVRPHIPLTSNGYGEHSSVNGLINNSQASNGDSTNEGFGGGDNMIAGKTDSPPGVKNGTGSSPTSNILRKASLIPLATMSTARCAMGAVELDGKLIVCGGYDRGECLQGVEEYSLESNNWKFLTSMQRPRGRFSMAVLDNHIYVCGGSDGWHELACVERFEPHSQTWTYVSNMRKQRSSHGVATLKGKLYCVGGCEGQRSMDACEVYDPKTDQWSPIAPLNSARSQACVVAINDKLLAIGGTDMWNTLNSVEVYDPITDQWTISSHLNIARRGSGVDVVDGQVIVVGGSDGFQSLTSSEILDTNSLTWTMGPQLITPRANLSVVAFDSRLFALGGFSGKKFLSTLEWLDMESKEWFGHTPKDFGTQKQVECASPGF